MQPARCTITKIVDAVKIQDSKKVSFWTYNWIGCIILFAHDPWHTSLEANCHLSSPTCIILGCGTTIILLQWTIFIFNLLKFGKTHGRTGNWIRRELRSLCWSLLFVSLYWLINRCSRMENDSVIPERGWWGHPEIQIVLETSSWRQSSPWILPLLPFIWTKLISDQAKME